VVFFIPRTGHYLLHLDLWATDPEGMWLEQAHTVLPPIGHDSILEVTLP